MLDTENRVDGKTIAGLHDENLTQRPLSDISLEGRGGMGDIYSPALPRLSRELGRLSTRGLELT